MGAFHRLLNVFRRRRLDEDFEEELRFHRELSERRGRERGLTSDEAKAETNRRLGNLSIITEEMRDARVANWLDSCIQDLRHGVRLIRRDTALSLLILLILAVGIGGNAAIFSLMKAAFFDPLPYPNSERLMTIDVVELRQGLYFNPSISEFMEIRKRTQSLEQLSFAQLQDFQITGIDEPVRVLGTRVTSSFFSVLGVSPALGRGFTARENEVGGNRVAILSDSFWRTRMGADPNVLGRTLRFNDDSTIIVGVLPPGFNFDYPTLGFPEPPQIYVPFPMQSSYPMQPALGGGPQVRVIARLRDGVTQDQAAAELQTITNEIVQAYPKQAPGGTVNFKYQPLTLREAIIRGQRSLFWLLLAGVAVLLMIACANTALLLLSRSLRRRKEVSIRAALGAGRRRLLRQFLLEGFVLATLGGLTGLVLSRWIARLLIAMLPIRTPILESARLDTRVIAFTMTLSLLSAIAFAIIPALKGSSWRLSSTLGVNSIGAGGAWRNLMIAVEAALSLFLLCAAALIAQNLWTMISAPEGFNSHNLLVMQVPMATARQRAIRPIPSVLCRDYIEKIAAIPQVDAVAVSQGIPLRPRSGGFVRLVGEPGGSDPDGGRQIAWVHNVSPDYFRTFGIPLLQGRTFRNDDIVGRPLVAIVNEKFLRQHSIASNPIGRQIDDPDGPITIVGVVANTRTRVNPPTPEPQIYTSYLQFFGPNVPYIVVRSSLSKAELLSRVKAAIRSSYTDQSVFNVVTMDEFLSNSAAEPRFNALLVGAFALGALAMAATGMYSVIACLVSQRTSEIALRVALGARRLDVIVTVLGKTCIWVLAGLLSGVGLAIGVSNTIRHLSNSVTTGSPLIYSLAFVIFLAVTVIATYVPLRRALTIDPTIALRYE